MFREKICFDTSKSRDKTPYRYSLRVSIVDHETDKNVCFLGQANLKQNATVLDLERKAIYIMEKAYYECIKKWEIRDGKVIKKTTNAIIENEDLKKIA